MICIKCANPKCTAPDGEFLWDERAHVENGGGLADPNENGAVSFVAECPYCGTEFSVKTPVHRCPHCGGDLRLERT